jgi:phospholipid-binding lipoprotein MlaA
LNIAILLLVSLLTLSGCCAGPKNCDPLQGLNRATYAINKKLDTFILKPTAVLYNKVIPCPIQFMIGSFFQNLGEIPTIANDILQLNFPKARHDTARFIINTTWGIGGLVDIAAGRGKMKPTRTDFGVTLARWGYKESIYFVIPLFGPSTLRDTYGRVVTYYMGVWPWIRSRGFSNGLYVLNLVDLRAQYLKMEPLLDQCVDEYI